MTPFQKTIFLTFFVLLALWFYWYQYRPSEIRKECLQKIRNEMKKRDVSNKGANHIYRACLVSQGMEPKNLLDLSP